MTEDDQTPVCIGFQQDDTPCPILPSWAVLAGGYMTESLSCGRHLAWVLGVRLEVGQDARVEKRL